MLRGAAVARRRGTQRWAAASGQWATLAAYNEGVLGVAAAVLRPLSAAAPDDTLVWPPPAGSIFDTRLAQSVVDERERSSTPSAASPGIIHEKGSLRTRLRQMLREKGELRDELGPIRRSAVDALEFQDMRTLLKEVGRSVSGQKQEVAEALWTAAKADVIEKPIMQTVARLAGQEETPSIDIIPDESSEHAVFHSVFDTPDEVAQMLIEARTENVCILDVQNRCTFTNFMIIATGRSAEHLSMAAHGIAFRVKERCTEVAPAVSPRVEGEDGGDWLAVDCGNVVVHVFTEEARDHYDLEGLWGHVRHVDGPQQQIAGGLWRTEPGTVLQIA